MYIHVLQTRRILVLKPLYSLVQRLHRSKHIWHISCLKYHIVCAYGDDNSSIIFLGHFLSIPLGHYLWVMEIWTWCDPNVIPPKEPMMYTVDDTIIMTSLFWYIPCKQIFARVDTMELYECIMNFINNVGIANKSIVTYSVVKYIWLVHF